MTLYSGMNNTSGKAITGTRFSTAWVLKSGQSTSSRLTNAAGI